MLWERLFQLAAGVLARTDLLVVDSISQARKLSSELMAFCGSDETKWARSRSLSIFLESGQVQLAGDDIRIFKSLGMGISDLALAVEIYQRLSAWVSVKM
jgi:alanine dehydrogenase